MHSIYVTQVFVDVSYVIVHLIHFTNIISDFMCALLPTLPLSNIYTPYRLGNKYCSMLPRCLHHSCAK